MKRIRPLQGIRVLELSGSLPHPYCTMLLTDLGADTIQVERPAPGGPARSAGASERAPTSTYVNVLDHHKRSVEFDLRSEEGKGAYLSLARRSDVVVDGMRPGKADALGVGYEHLATLNRRLVYCSINGYGTSGPYADLPGHDMNYMGVSGILGLTGAADGPPVLPSIPVLDMSSGVAAAFAIVTALYARDAVGEAQFIDVSMTDLAVSFLSLHLPNYFGGQRSPERGRLPIWEGPWLHVYECQDGKYVTLANLEAHFWRNFCEAVDRPQWADLLFFFDGAPEMKQRQGQILSELEALMRTKTRDEWFDLLRDRDVAIAPVNYPLEEVFSDPHVQARGLVTELHDEQLGTVPQVRHPIVYSHFDTSIESRWPNRGEHTQEVLDELRREANEQGGPPDG